MAQRTRRVDSTVIAVPAIAYGRLASCLGRGRKAARRVAACRRHRPRSARLHCKSITMCAWTCSCKIARLISFAGHALTFSTFFSVKYKYEIKGLQAIMKAKSQDISRSLLRAGATLAIATALSACASKPGPWPARALPANAAVTVDATQFLSRKSARWRAARRADFGWLYSVFGRRATVRHFGTHRLPGAQYQARCQSGGQAGARRDAQSGVDGPGFPPDGRARPRPGARHWAGHAVCASVPDAWAVHFVAG